MTDWELVSIAEFKKISVFYEVVQSESSLHKVGNEAAFKFKRKFYEAGGCCDHTLALALAGRVRSTVVTESPEVGYPR